MTTFPLPADTLAEVIRYETERDDARAAMRETERRCREGIDAAYAAITGVRRFDIVLATSRTRRGPQPMLVNRVHIVTGHRNPRVDPADVDDMDVTLTCRYVTADGQWSKLEVHVETWEPYTGDDTTLPTSLPADLIGEQ